MSSGYGSTAPLSATLSSSDDTGAAVARDLAREAERLRVQTVDPDEFLVYRTGDGEPAVLDLEHLLHQPRAKHGRLTVFDGPSLSRYVNSHRIPAFTALYADPTRLTVTAILNGHEQAMPTPPDAEWEPAFLSGWGDHLVTLQLRKTREWQHWRAADGKLLGQEEFAEHIETGLPEIREPAGADMLELAQSFHAQTSSNFKSARRLDSGETQLVWEEETTAQAGRSRDITIPRVFELAVRPFEGSDAYRVEARLRYRTSNGRLSIGYQLTRPDDVERAVFDDVLAEVQTQTTLTAYCGSAPEPLR